MNITRAEMTAEDIRISEVVMTMVGNLDRCRSHVVHLGNGIAVIQSLTVPPDMRRKGIGTDRLLEICGQADADQETLVVNPTPLVPDAMTRAQLETWFMQNGFVPNRGVFVDKSINHSLYRRPRGEVPSMVHEGSASLRDPSSD